MKNRNTLIDAAIAMLTAGILYLVIEFTVAGAWTSPVYDWANNFVPDLGNSAHGNFMDRNIFSPLYRWMNFGFIFQGILFGSAAVLISRALSGKIRSTLIIAGIVHALGLITVAIFHQTAGSIDDGTIFINIAGAALAIIAGNGIVIIVGSQRKKLALPTWFGWTSIVLGSLAILLGFALFGNSVIAPGVRERMSIYSFIFWQVITGLILIFSSKNKSEEIDDAEVQGSIEFYSTEVVLPEVTVPEGLLIIHRQINRPGAGEVVIQVEATGISFAERAMMRGKYPGMPTFPFTPGYDLVGTVVAIGPGLETNLIGKRVAVLTKTGGWASYYTAPAIDIMEITAETDPGDAEAVVVNGITAWQMLHRKANIQAGQTILVLGANGGVGTVITQLAIVAGAKVIGASAPKYHALLKKQGVIPIDHDDPDFLAAVKKLAPSGIDSVFDNIGGASISRSFATLKPGGVLVSYAISYALNMNSSVVMLFMGLIAKLFLLNYWPNGKKAVFYNIWTGKGTEKFRTDMREDFAEIIGLLNKGVLKPEIAARFPLEKVVKAVELAESRTTYGKILLIP